eukprot:scaffold108366_cov36-Phaeocystis_antarctica.AAC.1
MTRLCCPYLEPMLWLWLYRGVRHVRGEASETNDVVHDQRHHGAWPPRGYPLRAQTQRLSQIGN